MNFIFSLCLVILLITRSWAENITSNRIFRLPRLIVHTDRRYLIKGQKTDLSCQIEPGWHDAKFSGTVKWYKDNTPISDIKRLHPGEIVEKEATLTINTARGVAEGNYQCQVIISGVKLAERRNVTVNLISAPVKLKRARITRFNNSGATYVTVELGSTARIPCEGIPDVVPGPPAISFQKGEDDKSPEIDQDDYWVTSDGMQVKARKYEYAGKYYCSVGNEYTNTTKKSRFPVTLRILQKTAPKSAYPRLVYPLKANSLEKPIVVNINRGRAALLECIIENAEISWTRLSTDRKQSTKISVGLSESESKFRLRFSNLDIFWVDEGDKAIYVCEGRPTKETIRLIGNVPKDDPKWYPKVYYYLHVRSPTNVKLDIGQLQADQTWQLKCLAQNVDYEIPIVYVNGMALQDAMDALGVPPSTAFYTNPTKVTLEAKTILSGSVQCISRPAMDEAEIYGDNLERGRSINLYVDNSEQMQANLIEQGPQNQTVVVGATANLTCIQHKQGNKLFWIKDGKIINILNEPFGYFNHNLMIKKVQLSHAGWYTCQTSDSRGRTFRASAYLKVIEPNTTHTPESTSSSPAKTDSGNLNGMTDVHTGVPEHPVLINATLTPFTMDVPRASVTGRSVRLNWSYPEHHPISDNITSFKVEVRTSSTEWFVTEEVPSYVKGTTIGALVPGNSYKFRVVTVFSGHPSVNSFTTDWVIINQTENGIMVPSEPAIEKTNATDTTLKLRWKISSTANNDPERFFITYGKSSEPQNTTTLTVDGQNASQIMISGLVPTTEYRITVTAHNSAGHSPPSQPIYSRTHAAYDLGPRNETSKTAFRWFGGKAEEVLTRLDTNTVIITVISILLAIATALIICVLCCTAQTKRKKITKAAKGKFADTSHRIFNEQLVLKQRIHYNNKRFRRRDDDDEYSPLKSAPMDNHADTPTSLQNFNFELKPSCKPNLYGEDPNYYNEDAMISSTLTNDKQSYMGTNSIPVYTPTGSAGKRSTNYGELMLCSDSPEGSSTPLCNQRNSSKYDGSLCRESASSAGGTSMSNLDASSAVMMLTADKPPVIMRPVNQSPMSASIEEERRTGNVSRNSQALSSDRVLQTFKPGSRNTISFLSTTFDQKQSSGNISRDGIFAPNSQLKTINSRYSIT